jgi:drug/metabolite transporter (DMT)-like permease
MQNNPTTKSHYTNLILLLILGTLWGSSYLFIKVAVAEIPPLTLVAGRLAVASTVLWLALPVLNVRIPSSWPVWRHYAMLGLFGTAIPYSLITWGEQSISSGLASLLQSTTPIFTVLFASLLVQDERVTLRQLGGVVAGFAGVAMLVLPDLLQGMRGNLFGQLAIVGSSLCYAWTALYARSRLRGNPPLASATGQLTMGAVLMLPFGLVAARQCTVVPSTPVLASWGGLTFLGTVLAYGLYFALIDRTSATFIPIVGLLLGALVLGEPLDLTIGISLVLILVGVLVVRGSKNE